MAPTARMTNIIANVRDFVQAISEDGFSDAQITRNVNAAVYEVARAGYFKTETTIDLPASTTELDLLDAGVLPDLIEVYAVYGNPDVTSVAAVFCESYRQFLQYKQQYARTSSTRTFLFAHNTNLHIWPASSVLVADALVVWHSHNVDEIDIGAVPTDPPFPAHFDRALEFYAAKLKFMSAIDTKLADRSVTLFGSEWEKRKNELLAQGLNEMAMTT